jgi:hypothetical protein
VERKLAAILCADVYGYSRLMGENEEATLHMLTSHRKLIDSAINQHHGRFVNSAGDSVLAEFASVVEAVNCAVEVQSGLRTENANLSPERRMEFRIGVNLGDVMVEGDQLTSILASRHRFGELMAASQAAFGMALSELWQLRGGSPQSVTTSVRNAVRQHHGIAFMRQNGRKLPFTDYGSGVGVDSALSGEFYPTRDGRFVKIELFYPRLRDAMFNVLKCAPTQRAAEAAIMQWDAEALELAIREESGAIGVVRTAAEWLAHPVGRRLAAKPVIEIEKIGDSDPIPLPKAGGKPLEGIRVLDCTHVIGGPVTASARRGRGDVRVEYGLNSENGAQLPAPSSYPSAHR